MCESHGYYLSIYKVAHVCPYLLYNVKYYFYVCACAVFLCSIFVLVVVLFLKRRNHRLCNLHNNKHSFCSCKWAGWFVNTEHVVMISKRYVLYCCSSLFMASFVLETEEKKAHSLRE